MLDFIALMIQDVMEGTGKFITRTIIPSSFYRLRVAHVFIGYTVWIALFTLIVMFIRSILV